MRALIESPTSGTIVTIPRLAGFGRSTRYSLRHQVGPYFLNTLSSGVTQFPPDDWTTIYDVKPLYAAGIDWTGRGSRFWVRPISSVAYGFLPEHVRVAPSQIEMHLVGPDPGVTSSESEAALWLVFQSANGTPQFIEVPLAFLVGASNAISIGGVTNSASFKQVFAPEGS